MIEYYGYFDGTKLKEYAQKKFDNIESIKVYQNTSHKLLLIIQYKTQTEGQKKYGYFTLHEHRILIDKLPKRYHPDNNPNYWTSAIK